MPAEPCPFQPRTRVFGHPCEYWPRIDSTNTRCKVLAANGAAEGTVVSATYQTAGRGQRAADWLAPSGENMLMSILCRPPFPPEQALVMTLGMALVVKRALLSYPATEAVGRAVQFKWPNDVMVAGRKLSGILLESTISGGRMDALVAGVGLNLNTFFDESISNEINAVSCRMLTGQWIDVHRFSAHFLEIFENVYFEWIKNKLNPVISEWEKYSLHKNRSVSVRLPEETVIGTFAGLTSGGFLRLRQKNGAIRIITAGKVVEY